MSKLNSELIKQKLNEFDAHIDQYRKSLNTEAVWLFLATLGCWSVTHIPSQIFAIFITFILFTHRVYSQFGDKRTFAATLNELKEQIGTLGEDGNSEVLSLYENIRTVKLSVWKHLRSTWIFLLCYSFVALTLWRIIVAARQ